jgi:hypothetical protein
VLEDYEEEYILENLEYVKAQHEKGGVKNIGSYTLKALEEDFRNRKSRFDIEKEQKREREKQIENEKREAQERKNEYRKAMEAEVEKVRNNLPQSELERIESEAWEKVRKEKGDKGVGLKLFQRLECNNSLLEKVNFPRFEEWEKQHYSEQFEPDLSTKRA